MYHVWNITCTGDRSLTGNQVVIERQTKLGALSIFEVFIFRCSKGTYSYFCDRMCSHCFDTSCDGYTGVCEKGCVDGWYGKMCDLECPYHCLQPHCREVEYTEYLECKNLTVHKANDTHSRTCNRNGDCLNGCVAGWIGSRCDRKCSEPHCARCQIVSNKEVCTSCREGYYIDDEDRCQRCPHNCISCNNASKCTICRSKLYGKICHETCNENCIDRECRITGECSNGCSNSKYGSECTLYCAKNCIRCVDYLNCTLCSPGFYGRYCTKKCLAECYNCTSQYECLTCLPGYYGSYCEKGCPINCHKCTDYNDCTACKAGFYGQSCESVCLESCLTCEGIDNCTSCRAGRSGFLCHCNPRCEDGCGVDRECMTGCALGWYGNNCSKPCLQENCQECNQMTGNCTQCTSGKYGETCEKSCQEFCLESICNRQGICDYGCKEGFSGTFCQSPSSDTGSFGKHFIYIICTLGIFLLGLLLVTIGILIQKKRRQEATRQKTYETANISPCLENAVYDRIQPDPVYHTIDCYS